MLCTEQTMVFYQKTLGKFIEWLDQKGVREPDHISSKHIRKFLAGYKERGCSDSYIHSFTRSIRTYTRFLEGEGYVKEIVTFQKPRIGQKRLPVLSIEEVNRGLLACHYIRNKSILFF